MKSNKLPCTKVLTHRRAAPAFRKAHLSKPLRRVAVSRLRQADLFLSGQQHQRSSSAKHQVTPKSKTSLSRMLEPNSRSMTFVTDYSSLVAPNRLPIAPVLVWVGSPCRGFMRPYMISVRAAIITNILVPCSK